MKNAISTHEVEFKYKDGQTLNIKVPSHKVNSFLENLGKSTMFWMQEETKNQYQNNGFWTNVQDIRFIRAELIQELNGSVVVK